MEAGASISGGAEGAPRSRLRHCRAQPLSDLRTLRPVPHAASRISRPVRRLKRTTMKIVIPGGSGQVGTILARAFHADRHHVVVLSRRPEARPWRVVSWD